MNATETIPVTFRPMSDLGDIIEKVNERIRNRAFEYYVQKGFIDGFDQDDWLRAESDLVVKPNATVRRFDRGFSLEIDLPEVDLEEVMLFAGPHELAVLTHTDEPGRRLIKIVQLPEPFDPDSVHAELTADGLQITVESTATIAQME